MDTFFGDTVRGILKECEAYPDDARRALYAIEALADVLDGYFAGLADDGEKIGGSA